MSTWLNIKFKVVFSSSSFYYSDVFGAGETYFSHSKKKKKKSMWEPGVQQTCVIITSVQAACHIWHRGAENRRGTAQKTKKSARLQSFLGFFCQDLPAEDDERFMPRHWRTSSGQNRKGRGYNSRPCPSKCRKAKATVSFDQSVATL